MLYWQPALRHTGIIFILITLCRTSVNEESSFPRRKFGIQLLILFTLQYSKHKLIEKDKLSNDLINIIKILTCSMQQFQMQIRMLQHKRSKALLRKGYFCLSDLMSYRTLPLAITDIQSLSSLFSHVFRGSVGQLHYIKIDFLKVYIVMI